MRPQLKHKRHDLSTEPYRATRGLNARWALGMLARRPLNAVQLAAQAT